MESEQTNKPDIASRQDVEKLMAEFYKLLLADDSISFLFTEVAQIDLESHLPHLVDFWESQLLGANNYSGNPMQVHLQLNGKHPLTKRHFEIWLKHFNHTVDAHFSGTKAHLAKERALSIATVMQIKLLQ